MNTQPDDALSRAVAAGRAALQALRKSPPKPRPRPLTRQAYLDALEADMAEVRALGYSNAEIARALSLDARTAKALDLELDELPVTERAVRRGGTEGGKTAISGSLKAKNGHDRKGQRTGGGGGRRAAGPTAPTPTLAQADGDPAGASGSRARASDGGASDRDLDHAETLPGSEALMAGGDALTDAVTGDLSSPLPTYDAERTTGSAADGASDLVWQFQGSDTAKVEADKAFLRNVAKGFAHTTAARLAQGEPKSEPAAELPF